MKKLLIITLSMLLVLGATAAVFATDITLNGEITVRGETSDNLADYNSDAADSAAFYDQRVRLGVNAKVTPNTSGVLELEHGAAGAGDVFNWGTANAKQAGAFPALRQAYIHHTGSGLLGMNSGIKIGHLLPKLGNGLFLDQTLAGSDGIVVYAEPQKGTTVSFITLKLAEGNLLSTCAAGTICAIATAGNDDIDTYTIDVSHAIDSITLGLDLTYANDQAGAAAPIGGAGTVTTDKGWHFWNLGLRGDTDVSGIKLKADVELQKGESKSTAAGTPKTKYSGYAWLVNAGTDVSDINLDLEVAYGSGDKIETANKWEGFVSFLGTDSQHYSYVYEDRACAASAANNAACVGGRGGAGTGTGLTNTWYVKVGADTDVNPDLNVGADIYFLRAAKHLSAATNLSSKDIGTEFDANMTYKIDTNLVYFVQGGYLWAGSLYNNYFNAPTTANPKSDNPYVVRHGVSLTF